MRWYAAVVSLVHLIVDLWRFQRRFVYWLTEVLHSRSGENVCLVLCWLVEFIARDDELL